MPEQNRPIAVAQRQCAEFMALLASGAALDEAILPFDKADAPLTPVGEEGASVPMQAQVGYPLGLTPPANYVELWAGVPVEVVTALIQAAESVQAAGVTVFRPTISWSTVKTPNDLVSLLKELTVAWDSGRNGSDTIVEVLPQPTSFVPEHIRKLIENVRLQPDGDSAEDAHG